MSSNSVIIDGFTKTTLLISCAVIALGGSLLAVGVVGVGVLIVAAFRLSSHVAAVRYSLITASVVFALGALGGSRVELAASGVVALRIFVLMCSAAVIGASIGRYDMLQIVRTLRLGRGAEVLVVGVVSATAAAVEGMRDVVVAQRSRGLEVGPRSIFKIATYRALTVPFIVTFLTKILAVWVVTNLETFDVAPISLRIIHCLVVALVVLLWFL